MFNFQNITSYEFELLARDIMQKKLDIELRTYAAGRDGGIDIRGFIGNEIIIQAKHYVKSNFSNLRGALKKELVKIKKLKPKRYIIVTSFSLTPDNEDYIYNLFKDYMVDKRDIVDINFLNTFLENEDNIDILKKHNKLWLTSTNVLNMIFSREIDFDSRSFMQDYEEKSRLFVYSKAYYDTLNILEKNNILILEGAPGVGKSTLSKMLVADFCEKGYKFLYASSNSISEIKKGITPTEKEIILMDNFLGQRVTDISSHFFSEFKLLIDFVIS
uniref:nSTAND3 domain-containing NTPase n=1 Tax=Metasolibacillus meyeri TaxID=1071052 RepID=UPI00187D4C4D